MVRTFIDRCVARVHMPLWALPLLTASCVALDNDGSSGDDQIATILGVCGVITFLVGIGGDRKSAKLILVGIALIIA